MLMFKVYFMTVYEKKVSVLVTSVLVLASSMMGVVGSLLMYCISMWV